MFRTSHHRRVITGLALAVASSSVVAICIASPAGATGRTTTVRPGQSIQAAIDAAHRGQRIVVRAGTYAEQLTITTDGISLVGQGAVLVPPAAPITNLCSGLAGPVSGPPTQAGICVAGSGVELASYDVEHRRVLAVADRVADVSINGFAVKGFSGPNVALVGARNAHVAGNDLVDGDRYGALTAGSIGTRITSNTVRSTGGLHFIGICMDDVTPAVTAHNDVSGYNVGLCIQTQHADVRDNEVHDVCVGAFIDPGITARVRFNHIAGTNPQCFVHNEYGIDGIVVSGVDSIVSHNRIEGQTGPDSAGIVVLDLPDYPEATGNIVRGNILASNDLDILVTAASGDNIVRRNDCSTSSPAGLCH